MRKRWLCLQDAWRSPETTQHKGGTKVADFLGPGAVLRKGPGQAPAMDLTGNPQKNSQNHPKKAACIQLPQSPCMTVPRGTLHCAGRQLICKPTQTPFILLGNLSKLFPTSDARPPPLLGKQRSCPSITLFILFRCICVHVSSHPGGLPSRMEAPKGRSPALRLSLTPRTCACLTCAGAAKHFLTVPAC